ncbi:Hypothetical predicted protein [Mytilus galloprovincialis]|uniref:Uncharacterized protein n=1 Tax=Mytilus galloprovincialis TaxID=29158 RepID=A0A8B6F567_MYTGA|nr:Hypothetical predicted protein [Mytilus galloprovincialis]
MSSSEFTDNDTGTDKEEDTDDNPYTSEVFGYFKAMIDYFTAVNGNIIVCTTNMSLLSFRCRRTMVSLARHPTTTKVANKTGEKTKRLKDSEKDSGTAKKRQKNTTQIANKMGQTTRRRRIRK